MECLHKEGGDTNTKRKRQIQRTDRQTERMRQGVST